MPQWDTYLAESSRIDEFLIFVCGSFLVQWSKELSTMEFQDMIMFLQRVRLVPSLCCNFGLGCMCCSGWLGG